MILFIVAMFFFGGWHVENEFSGRRRCRSSSLPCAGFSAEFSEFLILQIRRGYRIGIFFLMRVHEPDQVAAV